jgi:hypothetical protein
VLLCNLLLTNTITNTVLVIPVTHDPPKRAAKRTPNHIALVIRGHVQARFGLKMKAEVLEGKIRKHFRYPGCPSKD